MRVLTLPWADKFREVYCTIFASQEHTQAEKEAIRKALQPYVDYCNQMERDINKRWESP